MEIRMVTKNMFFDRKLIEDKVGKDNKKAISHSAALVRRESRQSMRTVKNPFKSSQPGKPPYAHSKRIKQSILYGYDPFHESAVIGPSASYGVKNVPSLHEFGGQQRYGKVSKYAVYVGKHIDWGYRKNGRKNVMVVKSIEHAKKIVEIMNQSRASKHSRKYFVVNPPPRPSQFAKYPARPFMRPALTKMIPKIREMYPKTFGDAWKASI